MKNKIEINCLNTNTKKLYSLGTSLFEIIEDQNIKLKYPILGARVNNEIEELSYQIYKPKRVEFFDYTNRDGQRMYIRALSFVLIYAVKELYPEASLHIEHSISKGFYCELDGLKEKFCNDVIENIKSKMNEIIEKDLSFTKKHIEVDDAIEIFKQNNFSEKALLFTTCPELYTNIYYLNGHIDYFYGYLVPSTGYLKSFDLREYHEGMILNVPTRQKPEQLPQVVDQPKLYEIFREYKNWVKILGVSSIGRINDAVNKGRASELIKIGEALHEKKVAAIADMVFERMPDVKIILVAGPSASGKTTFSKRLAIQLKVAGLKPIQISLDDYFVNREDTPRDNNGEYDFESIGALDVELFNENYLKLKQGKEIEMPKFSFEDGKRYYSGETLKLEKDNVIIIEGIHALNPKLTEMIPANEKFRVYVSALTQIGIDFHNRIPTTDNRLIRRMVRDNKYRGYSALDTLKRWPSVRRGEIKNIFPYQEQADVMFNSALIYELGVLKKYAEPLLKEVPQIKREYSETQRLLKFLSYFRDIPVSEIPPTSILREFLYGSTFKY